MGDLRKSANENDNNKKRKHGYQTSSNSIKRFEYLFNNIYLG